MRLEKWTGRSFGAFCARLWKERDQLGFWHSRKDKMVASKRVVAVEMVKNDYAWICFEGRGTN